MRNEVKTYKDILLLIEKAAGTVDYTSTNFASKDLLQLSKEKSLLFTQPIVEELLNAMMYAPIKFAGDIIEMFGIIIEKNPYEVPINLVENFVKIVFVNYPNRFLSDSRTRETWEKIFKQNKINKKIACEISKLLELPEGGRHYIHYWDKILTLRPELIDTDMLINFTKMRRDDTGGGFYSKSGIYKRILTIKDQITDDVICSFLENLNIHEHPAAKYNILEFLVDIIEEMPDLFSDKVILSMYKTIDTLNILDWFNKDQIILGLCSLTLKRIENHSEDQSAKKILFYVLNHKNEEIRQISIDYTLSLLLVDLEKFKKIVPDILIVIKEHFSKNNLNTKDLELLDSFLSFLSDDDLSEKYSELITENLLEPLILHINSSNSYIKMLYNSLTDNNSSKRFLKEKFPNIDQEGL